MKKSLAFDSGSLSLSSLQFSLMFINLNTVTQQPEFQSLDFIYDREISLMDLI